MLNTRLRNGAGFPELSEVDIIVEIFHTKRGYQENENNPESYFCFSPEYEECYHDDDENAYDGESTIFVIATVLDFLKHIHTVILERARQL